MHEGARSIDRRAEEGTFLHTTAQLEVHGRAFEVEHRRDTVGEEEGQPVLRVEVEVHVHVRQTGHEVAPMSGNASASPGDVHLASRSNGFNPPLTHDHGLVEEDRPLVHGEHVHTHEGRRLHAVPVPTHRVQAPGENREHQDGNGYLFRQRAFFSRFELQISNFLVRYSFFSVKHGSFQTLHYV